MSAAADPDSYVPTGQRPIPCPATGAWTTGATAVPSPDSAGHGAAGAAGALAATAARLGP